MKAGETQRADNATDLWVQQHAIRSTTLTSTRAATNLAESPLLRLPAELRNKVWENAYGGNVIHVEFRTGNRQITGALICKRCVEDEDPRKNVNCCVSRTGSGSISVPLVSKQYWAEASITFFASNAFSIDEPQVMSEHGNLM